MAKRIWKDRVVEFPRRFKDQFGNVLELTPFPGKVLEEGTPVNASNLNGLEDDLESHKADYATEKVWWKIADIKLEGQEVNQINIDIPLKYERIKVLAQDQRKDGASGVGITYVTFNNDNTESYDVQITSLYNQTPSPKTNIGETSIEMPNTVGRPMSVVTMEITNIIGHKKTMLFNFKGGSSRITYIGSAEWNKDDKITSIQFTSGQVPFAGKTRIIVLGVE